MLGTQKNMILLKKRSKILLNIYLKIILLDCQNNLLEP